MNRTHIPGLRIFGLDSNAPIAYNPRKDKPHSCGAEHGRQRDVRVHTNNKMRGK
jgi:hypothetical protein